jgi:hypothetical protein
MSIRAILSELQVDESLKPRKDETPQEYIQRLGEVSDVEAEEVENLIEVVNQYKFAPDDGVTEKEVREQLEILITGVSTAEDGSQSNDLSFGNSSGAGYQGKLQSYEQKDETVSVINDRANQISSEATDKDNSTERSTTDIFERIKSPNWNADFLFHSGQYISNIVQSVRGLILGNDKWRSRSHIRSNFPLIVNNPTDADLIRILRYFPLLFLIPVLTVPPAIHHAGVEFGHYSQSIALLNDGLTSFTYLTPQESFAGLHLYSILSAPLIAIGYTEGGRLVSFLAAIGTTVLAAKVAREEFDEVNYLFLPVLLWANSFFVFFASAIGPNVLSIFLTTAIIYTTLVSLSSESDYWTYATFILLMLAILNHGWEATIALPVFILYLYERRYISAITIPVVTVVSVGILQFGTALQPDRSGAGGYSIMSSGLDIYHIPTWWTPHLQWPFPLGPTTVLLLVGSIAFVFWWTERFVQYRSRRSAMMIAWLLSGLFIPVILPVGYIAHMYYLWGIVVPFTLSLGALLGTSYQIVSRGTNRETARRFASGLLVVLLLWNVVLIGSFHAGIFDTPGLENGKNKPGVGEVSNSEAIRAGERLADTGIKDSSQIVFVGNWETTYAGGLYKPSQVLAYAGINVKHAWLINNKTIPIAAPNESVRSRKAIVRLIVKKPADSPYTNELRVENCESGGRKND